MKLKKITTFLFAMVAVLFSTTLISCTDDKTELIDNIKIYTLGMSEVAGSSKEIGLIFDTYNSALGIAKGQSTFELSGNDTAANDAVVKSKCEKAQKELSTLTIEGYFVISVKRGINQIHSAPFGTK